MTGGADAGDAGRQIQKKRRWDHVQERRVTMYPEDFEAYMHAHGYVDIVANGAQERGALEHTPRL